MNLLYVSAKFIQKNYIKQIIVDPLIYKHTYKYFELTMNIPIK